MKNIEYKVRVQNHHHVLLQLRALKARKIGVVKQTDTYIPSTEGRFKIRQIYTKQSELIFYKRQNKKNSKTSFYDVIPLSAHQGLLVSKIFLQAYKKCIVVRKKREVWMYKHTRIHLDVVERLGKFVELETVVKSISPALAKKEHTFVKESLLLEKYKALANSYSDMINRL